MEEKKDKIFPCPVCLMVVIIVIVAAAAVGAIFWWQKHSRQNGQVACTQEAKLCPNGSYVGRTGPNCEFAACPGINSETANWQTYRNEEYSFEVKYPQDWVVYYSSGKEPPYYIPLKAQSYFQPKDKTVPLVGIEAMGSTWEQEIAALNIEYEQYQQLTIDGYEAIKKEEVISNDASIRIAVNGPQKKVYEIILHEFAITKTQTDVEIFNQILSTFKFTK